MRKRRGTRRRERGDNEALAEELSWKAMEFLDSHIKAHGIPDEDPEKLITKAFRMAGAFNSEADRLVEEGAKKDEEEERA